MPQTSFRDEMVLFCSFDYCPQKINVFSFENKTPCILFSPEGFSTIHQITVISNGLTCKSPAMEIQRPKKAIHPMRIIMFEMFFCLRLIRKEYSFFGFMSVDVECVALILIKVFVFLNLL